jgi:hypothetical protein
MIRTSLRSAVIPLTNCLALPESVRNAPLTPLKLVQLYGTLDGILEAGLFQTQAETLRLFRLIATRDAFAAALARRPEADMGLSVDPCRQLEAKSSWLTVWDEKA